MFYSQKIKEYAKKLLTSHFAKRMAGRLNRNNGLILALHRIDYRDSEKVQCSEHTKISPEFLEALIILLREAGYIFVSIDEVREALIKKKNISDIACITLDDGYRDNLLNGLPIFKKFSIPFTIYLSSAMIDGDYIYWWELLNDIISLNDKVVLGDGTTYRCREKNVKERVFMDIRERIIRLPKKDFGHELKMMFANYNLDLYLYSKSLPMNWGEVRKISQDGLATIGSHTHSHGSVTHGSLDEVRSDIKKGNDIIRREIGVEPRHFCYPYGNLNKVDSNKILAELHFKTAVTSEAGNLYEQCKDQLYSLPRFFVSETSGLNVLQQSTWLSYFNK